ncbi:MAG: orotate phosphoribosyltransferase [Bacteroidetes bacterium]|nr:orotate phosphoribosyltransferase [Bacteroidota bacterium]
MITIQQTSADAVASLLLEIGAIRLSPEKPFTWSSGWKSPVYCDNRLTLSYPDKRSLIRNWLAEAVQKNFPDAECIAGVATAGVPQGALVADQLQLPYVYVRPKPKDHGMQNLIEGKVVPGQKVVLIEDLVSTGGSSIKAAEALRDAGVKVEGMAAIFTYGFPTAENNFNDAKIPLVCLSDFKHLLDQAVKSGYMKQEQLELVGQWRENPAEWKP